MKIIFLGYIFSTLSFCNPGFQTKGLNDKNLFVFQDTTLRILTYGMAFRHKDEWSRRAIEKKYGFERYSVAGCLVTQSLVDSVQRHNATVDSILAKKHGLDWEKKFEKDLKALYKKEQKAIALIGKENRVIERIKAINEADFSFHYLIQETNDPEILSFTAYRHNYYYPMSTEIHFKIMVDLKKSQVIFKNDKVETVNGIVKPD